MNNSFNLNIKTPCSENFNEFTPTAKGGYCGSCQKEVMDFSKMNSEEIINYFKTRNSQDTCGRFNSIQLTTYPIKSQKRKTLSFLSGLGLACLALFSFGTAQAQGQVIKTPTSPNGNDSAEVQDQASEKNIVVKGTVTESSIPVPGVNIVLQGSTSGTITDFDGNFEFPVKLKKGDVLIFSFVGYQSQKVVISNEDSAAKVELKVDMSLDSCIIMGKVDTKKVYKSKRK